MSSGSDGRSVLGGGAAGGRPVLRGAGPVQRNRSRKSSHWKLRDGAGCRAEPIRGVCRPCAARGRGAGRSLAARDVPTCSGRRSSAAGTAWRRPSVRFQSEMFGIKTVFGISRFVVGGIEFRRRPPLGFRCTVGRTELRVSVIRTCGVHLRATGKSNRSGRCEAVFRNCSNFIRKKFAYTGKMPYICTRNKGMAP